MAHAIPHSRSTIVQIEQGTKTPLPRVSAVALGVALPLAVYLARLVNIRHAALFAVGLAAGVVLYHASFGFTTAWRVFASDRRSAGLRAQMLMLGTAAALFIGLLSLPQPVLGLTLRGSLAPVGVSVMAGAFVFGIGMQLGGGCASGTLYTAGGGNTRMVITLVAFIIGSLVGTRHAPFWESTPSLGSWSLLESLGPIGALLVTAAFCGGVAWFAARVERARHGQVASVTQLSTGTSSLLRGPWPLVWGALGLVAVNVATLLLAGRAWGVTSAFALWGAKVGEALGLGVSSWPYWAVPARAASLQAPVLTDVTTVMDVGIMLGALMSAGFASKFAPVWKVPMRSVAAAVVGGLLLGYGARMSFGCNIGAYFSGVASTSLHGWLWFASAFVGSLVGTRLRPAFGMTVERTTPR